MSNELKWTVGKWTIENRKDENLKREKCMYEQCHIKEMNESTVDKRTEVQWKCEMWIALFI